MSEPFQISESCDLCGAFMRKFTMTEAPTPEMVAKSSICAPCLAKGEKMSTPIADALKDEMLKVLNAPEPFGLKVLLKIEKMARAGRGMLAALGGMPMSPRLGVMQSDDGGVGDSEEGGQYMGSGVLAAAPYNETFGSDAIRNLVAGLPELLKIAKPAPRPADPASMVDAIERAEKNGMHELAEALKKKLMAFAVEGVAPTATISAVTPEEAGAGIAAGAGIEYCVCAQPVLSGAGICGRCGGSTADVPDDDEDAPDDDEPEGVVLQKAGQLASDATYETRVMPDFTVTCTCGFQRGGLAAADVLFVRDGHHEACTVKPHAVTIDPPRIVPSFVAAPARDPRAIDIKFFVSCSACSWYANIDTEAAAQSMQGIHNSACGQFPRTVTIDAPGLKSATIGSGG